VVLVSNTEVNRRRSLVEMAMQQEGPTTIDSPHHHKRLPPRDATNQRSPPIVHDMR
jgi:hypothetical protein